MDTTERRRIARRTVTLEVRYSTPTDVFTSLSNNLNEGGLFVETENPAPLGTIVELSFFLPGQNVPVKTRGAVVWSTTNTGSSEKGMNHSKSGMGIEFEPLSADDKERISGFIKSVRI